MARNCADFEAEPKRTSELSTLWKWVVRPEGENLDEIFSALADWNEVLKRSAPDIFATDQLKPPQP